MVSTFGAPRDCQVEVRERLDLGDTRLDPLLDDSVEVSVDLVDPFDTLDVPVACEELVAIRQVHEQHRGLWEVISNLVFAIEQARDNLLGHEGLEKRLLELQLFLHVLQHPRVVPPLPPHAPHRGCEGGDESDRREGIEDHVRCHLRLRPSHGRVPGHVGREEREVRHDDTRRVEHQVGSEGGEVDRVSGALDDEGEEGPHDRDPRRRVAVRHREHRRAQE
mmetsp:Transcript_30927/g.73469  ORF Transcript_30927/g.73469 Transcript_30927/m.73469 type:complete len:221 (+) Transcript_30927:736-1398(+)